MNKFSLYLVIIILFRATILSQTVSSETNECIDCHISVTPGIVADWKGSLHSKSDMQTALMKPMLERRISVQSAPVNYSADLVVGCFECHSLNPAEHKDNFEHFGYNINIVVSPPDCAICHPAEHQQYSGSKKYHAFDNLRQNPLYSNLVDNVIGIKEIEENHFKLLPPSHLTEGEVCYACHGTEVTVKGMKSRETVMGEMEFPELVNWPNHGVGRINPDNSRGSCTSCHPRHSFSIEIARKPYTCAQCHLEPDVPAYNVYKESKHGNIFDSKKENWNFSNVPWEPGKDFQAPTCATCHNSLLASEGEVITDRSHDFSARLWTRIFGLVYSHPQPISGKTFEIKNADGLNLPVTFSNIKAAEHLIGIDEQIQRKNNMNSVCSSCHGSGFSGNALARIDKTNEEADLMVKTATALMEKAWKEGIEKPEPSPFDEQIEILWQRQWLFYANSVRYATAMMGPDYAGFKNGWWELSQNLRAMKDLINLKGQK